MFAAVGTDGLRDVVWGLGSTPEESTRDADDQRADSDCSTWDAQNGELRIFPITDAQAREIEGGMVAWDEVQAVR